MLIRSHRFAVMVRLFVLLALLPLFGATQAFAQESPAAKSPFWIVNDAGDTAAATGGKKGTASQTGDLRYVLTHMPVNNASVQFDPTKLTTDPTTGTVRITLLAPLTLPNNLSKFVFDGLTVGRKPTPCNATTVPNIYITMDGNNLVSGFSVGKSAKIRFLSFVNFTGTVLTTAASSTVECDLIGKDATGGFGANGAGIQVNSVSNIIANSTITYSNGAGIIIPRAGRARINFNNIIENNGPGIYLNGGFTNQILSNIIDINRDSGIKIDNGGSQNLIGLNEIESNIPAGVTIVSGNANVLGFVAGAKKGRTNLISGNGPNPSSTALAAIRHKYSIKARPLTMVSPRIANAVTDGGVVLLGGIQNTVRGNFFPCSACASAPANSEKDIAVAPGANGTPVTPSIKTAVCSFSAAKNSSSCVFTGKAPSNAEVDFYANGFFVATGKAAAAGTFSVKATIKATIDYDPPKAGDTLAVIATALKGTTTHSTGEASDPYTVTS